MNLLRVTHWYKVIFKKNINVYIYLYLHTHVLNFKSQSIRVFMNDIQSFMKIVILYSVQTFCIYEQTDILLWLLKYVDIEQQQQQQHLQ